MASVCVCVCVCVYNFTEHNCTENIIHALVISVSYHSAYSKACSILHTFRVTDCFTNLFVAQAIV